MKFFVMVIVFLCGTGSLINIFPKLNKAPLVLLMNINGYIINPKRL